MFDRYELRDGGREDARARCRDIDRGGGGSGEASDRRQSDAPDVFTRDLNLPRGLERELVRARDRVHDIDGAEARMLATVGTFRVLAESDLQRLRDEARTPQQSIRYLEDQGLLCRSALNAEDRAVALTDRGRDLLEANRFLPRDGRLHEPRQAFHSGVRKPRELTHDVKVYRAYQRAEDRLRDQGGRLRRVVLDYELKRDYQRFLQERNRGRPDCDGRPDREPEEVGRWAREHDLPYDDGHVRFPDARIEYEDRDGLSRHEDIEVVTAHYRGAHAGGAAKSGFSCYRAAGGAVGGRGGCGGRGGGGRRTSHPRLAEELLR